jgi:hypothetical protein
MYVFHGPRMFALCPVHACTVLTLCVYRYLLAWVGLVALGYYEAIACPEGGRWIGVPGYQWLVAYGPN